MRWMSPELLDPDGFGFGDGRTKESDCYALGMVVYEVLSGQAPFSGSRAAIVLQKVIEGKHPERPGGTEGMWFMDDLWWTLNLCWATEPKSRPSIEAVLKCLGRVSRGWRPPPPPPSPPQADVDDWDLTTVSGSPSGTTYFFDPFDFVFL